MIPEIFSMQVSDGAWAITLSTLQQVRVAMHFGIRRIFFANILASAQEVAWICGQLDADPGLDFYCLIDSVEALDLVKTVHRDGGFQRPINVLIELGYPGGRTGSRTMDGAVDLGRMAAQASDHVRLSGVEGFEGLITADTAVAQEGAVKDYVVRLREVAEVLARERCFGHDDFILSAGGTSFLDIVVSELAEIRRVAPNCRLLLRSGCYISFDSGMYEEYLRRMRKRCDIGFEGGAKLEAALEIWGRVLSRPEPSRVIVGLGKRDVGHDSRMPIPLKWLRPNRDALPHAVEDSCSVVELNDQHAHLEVAANSRLKFGDLIGFGVSHPCTTFDRWRALLLVDDDYNAQKILKTYF